MPRVLVQALSFALALASLPTIARADVTVVYAPPPDDPPPLVAHVVSGAAVPAAVSATAPVTASATAPVTATATDPPRVPTRAADAATALDPAPSLPPPVAVVVAAPAHAPTPSAILVVRDAGAGDERASLPLTDADGRADPDSLRELALLARPRTLATRPSDRELAAYADDPVWVAAGVRRLHPGVAERLRALADHFAGHALEIVAGYRPDARAGSRHLLGLAIDVRVRGASLDEVHELVARFDRTGVGFYPTSGFVHLDVRETSVRWIDDGAPGDAPRVVRDDERPRGPRVRAADPIPTPAPATTASTATSASPRPERAEGSDPDDDAAPLDPDEIADDVVRALGAVRFDLPPPP